MTNFDTANSKKILINKNQPRILVMQVLTLFEFRILVNMMVRPDTTAIIGRNSKSPEELLLTNT